MRPWMAFVRALGTVQMVVLLVAVYWLFITFFAAPVRWFGDPLRFRRPAHSNWIPHEPGTASIESLGRQS